MSPLVFLDANIPIYAAGSPHPLKQPAAEILSLVVARPGAFVSDVEVVQELLHLYLARHAWNDGRTVVADYLVLMQGRLEPVLAGDLEQATRLADDHRDIASRDLVHAALMRRPGVTRIVSADADFDRIAGIERLDPARLAAWRATIAD